MELQPGMQDFNTSGLSMALYTRWLDAMNLCVPLSFIKPFLVAINIGGVSKRSLVTQMSLLVLIDLSAGLYCSGFSLDFQMSTQVSYGFSLLFLASSNLSPQMCYC